MAAALEEKPKSPGKRDLPVSEIETRPQHIASKKGSTGKKVILTTNYFKLINQTDWCIYQYRVDIVPDPGEDNIVRRKALLRTHKDAIGFYIFDGTVLYTSNRLPQPLELNSIREEDRQPINIKIRLVGDLVTGDYHYFQFFNIIIRKCLQKLRLQLIGRNYYDVASRIEIRDYRLQLWPGYITSIRQHDGGIMMCAEISHKIMREDTLLDILNECHRKDSRNYQKNFKSTVLGNVVYTAYNNRTYKIDDVDFNSNPSITFKMRDDTEISFIRYYKQRYQINIRNLTQPLVVSRSTARQRRAGNAELIYLVPELCCCTGLTDKMRDNHHLMKALADHTRINPGNRMQRLMNFNRRLNSKPEIVEDLRKWNFKLDGNLTQVPGRVLPAEPIIFDKKTIIPKQCDWNFDMQKNFQLRSVIINDWIAVIPPRSADAAKTFINALINAGRNMNIKIARPKIENIRNDEVHTYANALSTITDRSNPQMIFCVVPNNQLQRYSNIKKKLCINRPVPSQVILHKSLIQKNSTRLNAVASKVAVQMSCKLGGLPWTIKNIIPGLMVVGFDVCHDKRGDWGAMVASLDQNFGQYYSAVSKHGPGEELSNDISFRLSQAVEEFRKVNNNRLPSNIIFYRDGVGEGQIPFVYDYEVKQIKKMLSRIYGNERKLKLTFIIVTKRINTRIFLETKNPEPGTVVDDIITDPLKYDFFIVSQQVREGTVSPTAYNVIYDSTGISCDTMQLLTFKFCHMYYNLSGTVRVPAPCQYAHKLAFFVSQALGNEPHPALNKHLYFL